MADTWFVADTHFNHGNIILYENRPFKTKEEMNEVLIENWNKVVKPDDIVYHLGDVVFGGKNIKDNVLKRLNGYKILRLGNHDNRTTKKQWKNYFDEVYEDDIYLDGKFCLSHYPLTDYEMVRLQALGLIVGNIHGHLHSQWQHLDQSKYICVSVENFDYTPVHYDEVLKHFAK